MDTSMDDLFSDLEKSVHPMIELDEKKSTRDSFTCSEFALTERLDVTIWRSEKYDNAFVYEIRLIGETSRETLPIELLVPYSPTHTSSSQTKWPTIHPCVLCDTVDRSTESTKTSVPVFSVPSQLIRAIWHNHQSAVPKRVWLLGLINGWLYVFSRFEDHGCGTIQYAPLCALSTLGPVTHWNLLEDPILTDNRSVLNGPRPVSSVLFAFQSFGGGLALWVPNRLSQNLATDCLRATELYLPPPSTPVRYTQVHGSWVHLVTESGHIMSLHCAVALADDVMSSVDLVCQSTNFPRVPSILRAVVPEPIAAEYQLEPKWRYFDVAEFVRMSDGHLGIVQRSGRTAKRLVDLLCGPELLEPSISTVSVKPQLTSDKSEADMFLAHIHYQAYLTLLRLAGSPDGIIQSTEAVKPLSLEHVTSVAVQWTSSKTVCQPPDRHLEVEISLQTPPRPPVLPLETDQWDSLSVHDRAWLLLRSYAGNPLCLLEPAPLDLMLRVFPIYDSDTKDQVESIGPIRWSHVEPWFMQLSVDPDSFDSPSGSHASRIAVRRILLSMAQLTELYTRINDHPAELGALIGLQFNLDLTVRSPIIPTVLMNRLDAAHPYRLVTPSVQVSLGRVLLDAVHWLHPMEHAPLVSHPWITKPNRNVSAILRMKSVEQLRFVLSHIYSASNGKPSDLLPVESTTNIIDTCGKTRRIFIPTGHSVLLEWWHRTPEQPDENAQLPTLYQNVTHIRITSPCLQTLWCVRKSLERIQRLFGNSPVSKTPVQSPKRPTVEQLRQEYRELKDVASQLKSIHAKLTAESTPDDDEMDELISRLLFLHSCVRNTEAASLFSS